MRRYALALGLASASCSASETLTDLGLPPISDSGPAIDLGSLEPGPDAEAQAPDAEAPDVGGPDAAPPDLGPPDSGAPMGPPVIERFATGLSFPWGLDFLPDGRGLVTERGGQLRVLGTDGSLSSPIAGVPEVYASGQGGLLDVIVGPDFASDQRIYLCYAARENRASGTEVARARFDGTQLVDLEVVFRALPKIRSGSNHYGCRMAFHRDGYLFLGIGDRFNQLDRAQDLDTHLGKVMRIFPDGRVPEDNPFVNQAGARPEIWSVGHRNIQGMAVHPTTGEIWVHEHGPSGGDEINIPRAGENHGWPTACYGSHYDGREIPDAHQSRGFSEPVHFWTPSIAPSGMTFYDGNLFPEWRGQLFVGALAAQHLARLELDGERVVSLNRLMDQEARIREVSVGPDGALYVLTDSRNGEIYRIRR